MNLKRRHMTLKMLQAQTAFGECMTGAALQIFFEMLSQLECFEGRVEFDFPRNVLRCVWTLARIVISQPLLEIG